MLVLILTYIGAYLLGSFNAAYWIGKWFGGIDIRKHGSKNAGATNLLRVRGLKLALPAFIIDVAKSYVAANLAYLQNEFQNGSEGFILIMITLGIVAIIGHIFPLYIKFRGGKGVASMLGVVAAVHLVAAGASLLVFIIFLSIFRIVSLSSIIAGISFPVFLFFVFNESSVSLLSFSVLAAVLVLITHKRNIKRMLSGNEKRIKFR
jgi:glycerol-3-phosphate acyltransferase PlsY